MNELRKIFENEALFFTKYFFKYSGNNQYYSYLNLSKNIQNFSQSATPIVPRIMHYIWFTKESNSKQIPKSFLANLKLELNKLEKYNLHANEKWNVKLWISCKTCIEESLKEISSIGYPIEIIQWQLEDFGSDRIYLQNIVTNLIDARNGMGAAYDISRFIIAEKYGGFLPDFDYNTGNSTEIVVQGGYHSIAFSEINFFGFKPQHKISSIINDYISHLFEYVEEHKMNDLLVKLGSNDLTNFFGYGQALSFIENFMGKEDLFIPSESDICDLKPSILELELHFMNNHPYKNLKQCLVNPPEICYLEEQMEVGGSFYMPDSMVDFGGGTFIDANSWSEEWQEK
jgi:hypothetical protein